MILPRARISALLGCAAVLASCGPAATEGGFESANPAARMYAIEHAARDGDHSAIRHIIELLDSDDPAVRSLAIASLQRLTGETHGYRDYDPPHLRRAAIARWVAAFEAGEIKPSRSAPTSSTSGQMRTITKTWRHG